ncbi:laforin-like [Meriones unguiculatus]|uniref:laforin-like n=1 Tax=Meriones unguiculatus TaxID=10047 RepID=UPI00293EDF26|nr:laforin-like [Meriones unguiculatus]
MSARAAAPPPEEPGEPGTPPPPADPARARRPPQARVCATSGGGGRRRGGGGRARAGAAPARRPRGTRGGGARGGARLQVPAGGGAAGRLGRGRWLGPPDRGEDGPRAQQVAVAPGAQSRAWRPPGQLSPSGGASRAWRRAPRSQAPAQPLLGPRCARAPALSPPPLLLLLPPRPLHFYRLDSSTAPHGACAAPSLLLSSLLSGARGPVRPPSLRARRPAPSLSRSRARRESTRHHPAACCAAPPPHPARAPHPTAGFF